MKTYNDCIPCLVRQALGAARLVTEDESIHQAVLKKTLSRMSKMDMNLSPPMMARYIQQTIAEVTGNQDPYLDLKRKFNDLAMELYPDLKQRVMESSKPLETAIRLAIAGNIIDFGAVSNLNRKIVIETIDHAMGHDVRGRIKKLIASFSTARHILWLADNSGEIVFDRLVFEIIDRTKIVFVVRGGAVINDATLDDTVYTGISRLVKTMDTGVAIPGTVLDQCSQSFLTEFNRADLIVAKGQGNFETLSHDDSRIFFLFKAKCPVVAKSAGVEVGDLVVHNR